MGGPRRPVGLLFFNGTRQIKPSVFGDNVANVMISLSGLWFYHSQCKCHIIFFVLSAISLEH